MQGLLISKDGNVQVIGNADPLSFIDTLADLLKQLVAAREARRIKDLDKYSTDELVQELKVRASKDDTGLPE